MARQRTYLDWNATAPLRPEARAAMVAALDVAGNPSSVHAAGRKARAIVETAREQVASLVGAKPIEVIFTSGATEANAMVLSGRTWLSVVRCAIEHPSMLEANARKNVPITADPRGWVVLDERLGAALAAPGDEAGSVLATLQLANGETGVVQNVTRFVEVCRAHRPDAFVHTDAVQAAGRIAVDFKALGVDALTLSSHKLGGPQGVGALILREGVALEPLIRGGGQERGRRAGTENVAAIAGFGAAAVAAVRQLERVAESTRGWQRQIEAGVRHIAPLARIIGESVPRLPNTSCIAVPGMSAETLVIALDLEGIAVSAGSACSSGKVTQSPVLSAMGLPPTIAGSAIRVSTGWSTTADDIEAFLAAFAKVISNIRLARKVA